MTRKAAPAASDAPRTNQQQEAKITGPAPWLKLVISGLLALHIAAVFWAPFAFASTVEEPSPFADPVARLLRPYIQFFFLDHGYFFFAPNPGPSHLVRYKVEFDDGREPVVGTFPDIKTERPRLLYHRHFMLSEALNTRFVPPEKPPEPSPPPLTATREARTRYQIERQDYDRVVRRWQHARTQYEAMWNSYSDHLKHQHGGSKVTLTRVEHRLAAPGEVRYENKRLDAQDSYVDLPENPAANPPRGGVR